MVLLLLHVVFLMAMFKKRPRPSVDLGDVWSQALAKIMLWQNHKQKNHNPIKAAKTTSVC